MLFELKNKSIDGAKVRIILSERESEPLKAFLRQCYRINFTPEPAD